MEYKQYLIKLTDDVLAQGASDLHLIAGNKPIVRVSGVLTALISEPVLSNDDVSGLLESMVSTESKKRFSDTKELDFSWSFGDKARFRGNAYFERGSIGIALRLIPRTIRTLAELNLPQVLENFAARQQGFFLVVGR